jgi:hypothetical protein
LQAIGPFSISDTKLTIEHKVFVDDKMEINKWTVNKCVNCDLYVFAIASKTGEILINSNLLREGTYLLDMLKHENYSLPFKIILKPINLLPNGMKATAINDNERIKMLFGKLQDYISQDALETENEIRKLTQAMNVRRQNAEKQFQQIAALIGSIECNESNLNKSTNMMSIDNLATPPKTPENVQMTIDQHPLAKINHQFSSNNNVRDGLAKHNNAIVQNSKNVLMRNIDFEEDIFELDPDQTDIRNENDRYHKFSDTEENSEAEEDMIERRARARSGSVAIARSAPISIMSQLLNHDTEEELANERAIANEHDIASSIKLLAKSIHADSVFGELPNRALFKADF